MSCRHTRFDQRVISCNPACFDGATFSLAPAYMYICTYFVFLTPSRTLLPDSPLRPWCTSSTRLGLQTPQPSCQTCCTLAASCTSRGCPSCWRLTRCVFFFLSSSFSRCARAVFFSMVAKQSRCTHGFRVVRCLYYHDEVNFLLVLANLGCRRRRRPHPHRPAARRVPARICAPRVSRLGASVPFRNRSRERPRF